METRAISLLKNHGLRKTPFRLRVLEIFFQHRDIAMGNAQIEKTLGEFDRITLYRTLKTMEEAGIIHQAIDGSNEMKYALCSDNCTVHNHADDHAHFLCDSCGVTTCIDHIMTSPMRLPGGYSLDKVNIALTGTCPSCN